MPTHRLRIGRSLAEYLILAVCIVSLSTNLARVEGRKCICTSKACKEAGVNTCRTRFFCYTELILTTGYEIGQESTTTRGCTEGATPLLCETKSWITKSRSANAMEPSASPRVLVPWPKLKCCNSHDYCNADNDDDDDDDDNDDDDDDDDDDEDDDGHNNDDDTHNDDDDDDDDDDKNASTWTHEKKIRTNQTRFTMDRGTPMNGPRMSTNSDTTLQPDQKYDRKYENSTESYDRLLQNRIRALHVAALVLAVATLISVLASCYVITRFLRHNRYTMDTVNYS